MSDAKEKKDDEKEKKDLPALSKVGQEILERVEKLSVLELAELVKVMEDKFGVTASAPMAAMPMAAASSGGAENVEEKDSFNVILKGVGANKIAVIKALRTILPELGLKDAKDLADGAPKQVKEGANKEEANNAKKVLEEAGATVELQ